MAIVYQITHTATGKSYIGVTTQTLRDRWAQHCSKAKRGLGSALHDAIRQHGRNAFGRRVVGEGSHVAMLELERAVIAQLGADCYNILPGGTFRVGDAPPAMRAKLSSSAKQRAASEDRTAQLTAASAARWGKPGAREHAAALVRARPKCPKREARNAEIRRLAASGVVQTTIARWMGVSQATVSLVVLGKR